MSKNCMGGVTLNLPSYPELGLFTQNLLSKVLTKCGLGPHPSSKQLQKLIAGRTKPDRETVLIIAIAIFL